MQSAVKPKKSLGQHWLTDESILRQIVESAGLAPDDTVLEIGPGLGTLTKILIEKSKEVVAVEFDKELAQDLPNQVPAKNLKTINADFLQFDLKTLPKDYKVVANVPYYITAKIVQKLLTAENKPSIVVLLVQKEVAERLAANPGQMSVLAVSAQLFAEVSLGIEVPAEFFTPPPKVDSQVVIMKTYNCHSDNLACHSGLDPESSDKEPPKGDAKSNVSTNQVLNDNAMDEKLFFRIVKAGFSARRKKLRTSLAGGLNLSKLDAEKILRKANIDPNLRAQDLSLDDWANLTKILAISEN